MKYSNIIPLLFILFFSTSCFASPKPETCPQVVALKAVGVKYADTSLVGWQVSSDENDFGTKEVWVFGMMLIGDKSQTEAEVIAKANAKINLFALVNGPEKSDYNDGWQCTYTIPNSDDHTIGIAATVPNKNN